jgi:tetratricopeptide (TPR) repeat protein
MGQFFRGRGSDDGNRLEKELEVLEEQVRTATPGYETQFLNRAGNLCVDAGQPSRALRYYGRAIDAYLESGRFSAAEVLCRKVQQIAPQAVRVRCTLAWLALGKGANDNTRDEVRGYVEAALESGQEGLASKQLLMMAQATTELDLREEIARHLLELGATAEADHVFGLIFQERNGIRPPAVADQGKLWAKLLRAALMGPKELEERSWTKLEEENDALPSLPQKNLP